MTHTIKTARIKTGAPGIWPILLFLAAVFSLGVCFAGTSEPNKAAETIAPPAINGDAPSIFSPETRYEFSPVHDGALIQHDFSIHNLGRQDLEIKRVITA